MDRWATEREDGGDVNGPTSFPILAPTKDLKVPSVAWVLEGGEEGTEDMEGGEYVEGAEHGEGIGSRGSRMAPVEGMGELRRML
eukprot:gene15937-biopygen5460